MSRCNRAYFVLRLLGGNIKSSKKRINISKDDKLEVIFVTFRESKFRELLYHEIRSKITLSFFFFFILLDLIIFRMKCKELNVLMMFNEKFETKYLFRLAIC